MNIFIFREKRVNGKWTYYGDFPYETHDPDFFGWLDTMYESTFKAITRTRGLPSDIASETKARIKWIVGEDGGGESFLNFQEILKDIANDAAKQERFEEFIGIIKFMCENENPEDHRIVFCFV